MEAFVGLTQQTNEYNDRNLIWLHQQYEIPRGQLTGKVENYNYHYNSQSVRYRSISWMLIKNVFKFPKKNYGLECSYFNTALWQQIFSDCWRYGFYNDSVDSFFVFVIL